MYKRKFMLNLCKFIEKLQLYQTYLCMCNYISYSFFDLRYNVTIKDQLTVFMMPWLSLDFIHCERILF